jgi:hypothetical protein
MGADLMLNYVEIAEPRERAQARLDRLVITEQHLETFENCGEYQFSDEEFSEQVQKDMRARLQRALDVVYDSYEGNSPRDVTWLNIDGNRTFLFTGGMSWGDDPSDYYTDFWLFFEFLGYPSHLSPDSDEAKKWKEEANK